MKNKFNKRANTYKVIFIYFLSFEIINLKNRNQLYNI